MNDSTMLAAPAKTGVLLLGGGVPKHHILNAHVMKGGADWAVYVSTAQVGGRQAVVVVRWQMIHSN